MFNYPTNYDLGFANQTFDDEKAVHRSHHLVLTDWIGKLKYYNKHIYKELSYKLLRLLI